MKLLFTGSNGFLGKNILPFLKDNGCAVTTLDITNADINANLSREIPCFLESYDVVLHAAGKAHSVPKSDVEANLFFDVNLKGTLNLTTFLARDKRR